MKKTTGISLLIVAAIVFVIGLVLIPLSGPGFLFVGLAVVIAMVGGILSASTNR